MKNNRRETINGCHFIKRSKRVVIIPSTEREDFNRGGLLTKDPFAKIESRKREAIYFRRENHGPVHSLIHEHYF